MEKESLLLDVDEVVCFAGYLDTVNEFMGTNYEIDDFTEYYIDEHAIPKNRFEEFNEFISKKNLYENAHILPDAVEVLQRLNEIYDIYICSSCINPFIIKKSGRLFKEKYEFLITSLPFLDPEKFIFTNAKHLFNADIQIDDRVAKLDANVKTKILFPSYHNRGITDEELKQKGILRAGYDWRTGWKEVENILIKNPIKKRSRNIQFK